MLLGFASTCAYPRSGPRCHTGCARRRRCCCKRLHVFGDAVLAAMGVCGGGIRFPGCSLDSMTLAARVERWTQHCVACSCACFLRPHLLLGISEECPFRFARREARRGHPPNPFQNVLRFSGTRFIFSYIKGYQWKRMCELTSGLRAARTRDR